MLFLNNAKMMNKLHLTFFFNIVSITFLTWISNRGNEVPFGKSLENIYKQDNIMKINIIRLLAKHDIKRELEHSSLREKFPDRRAYKSKRNVYDNISAYSGVKSKASNNIDLYMKNYKKRYIKKKGLSKLDCYCENKVFNKFNNICDIGKKMKYDEKRSKNFFLKKYGIGLILFSLTPALGLIFPILFGINGKTKGILGYCDNSHFASGSHKNTQEEEIKNCTTKWIYEYRESIGDASYAPLIFSFITITVVVLFIIYILIKVIKYEKIKSGKGKMNLKQYSCFFKDLITAK